MFSRVSASLLLSVALLARRTGADDDLSVRARTEVAGYADGDHVRVFSPSITGAIESRARGASLSATYLVDVVSAASADIVSTASRGFRETRQVGSFDARYKPSDTEVRIAGGGSFEPDYRALSSSVTLAQDLFSHAHTLAISYGYEHDVAGRTGTPFSVFARRLDKHSLGGSATFTLDRRSLLTFATDVAIERGDPSKPYRYVALFAPEVAPRVPAGASVTLVDALRAPERMLERLPLARDRFASAVRYARKLDRSTLRLAERVYVDSWGLLASTTDARVIFEVGERLSLWPRVRFHAQKGASFYRRAYASDGVVYPTVIAGDRELGPLMTGTLGVGAQWIFGAHRLSVQVDGSLTRFFDALYLRARTALFSAIAWETTWR